jgi:hypothetical protein
MANVPPQPANSFRVVIEIPYSARLDSLLMVALRNQERNADLKKITRAEFKELFKNKRVVIKNQSAKPSSSIAAGTTHVDILGFADA